MATEILYTTSQVAAELGVTRSAVQKLQERYGVGRKVGRFLVYSPEDLAKLREISTGKRGRPRRAKES